MASGDSLYLSPQAKEIIDNLYRLRWVDKYETFKALVPGIENSPEHEKEQVVEIIEHCCTVVIRLYSLRKKPTVASVRNAILAAMDKISYANLTVDNKDFGYELCWYIAEKSGVSLRKHTEGKVYGYWKVEGNMLKAVTKRSAMKKKKDSRK